MHFLRRVKIDCLTFYFLSFVYRAFGETHGDMFMFLYFWLGLHAQKS